MNDPSFWPRHVHPDDLALVLSEHQTDDIAWNIVYLTFANSDMSGSRTSVTARRRKATNI